MAQFLAIDVNPLFFPVQFAYYGFLGCIDEFRRHSVSLTHAPLDVKFVALCVKLDYFDAVKSFLISQAERLLTFICFLYELVDNMEMVCGGISSSKSSLLSWLVEVQGAC